MLLSYYCNMVKYMVSNLISPGEPQCYFTRHPESVAGVHVCINVLTKPINAY